MQIEQLTYLIRKAGWIAVVILPLFRSGAQEAAEAEASLKALEALTGTWSVSVEARLSAQGPWETSQGNAVIARAVGGTIFEENFTGTRQGKPFIIKTLFAFNPLTHKYQRTFVDSGHGVLVEYEGEQKGNTFIFDRQWRYANQSTVKLRVVYTLISKNEFTVETMRLPDNATAWDTTGRMRYKKDI